MFQRKPIQHNVYLMERMDTQNALQCHNGQGSLESCTQRGKYVKSRSSCRDTRAPDAVLQESRPRTAPELGTGRSFAPAKRLQCSRAVEVAHVTRQAAEFLHFRATPQPPTPQPPTPPKNAGTTRSPEHAENKPLNRIGHPENNPGKPGEQPEPTRESRSPAPKTRQIRPSAQRKYVISPDDPTYLNENKQSPKKGEPILTHCEPIFRPGEPILEPCEATNTHRSTCHNQKGNFPPPRAQYTFERLAPLMHTSDEELYRRMKKGDRDAFGELYERRGPALRRYALHMSGSPTAAEEVAHEVFVQLMKANTNFDDKRGSLEGWMYGVARNLVRVIRRKGPVEEPVDQAVRHDIVGNLIHAENLAALQVALRELPELYRDAVVLCDLEEKSYEEAAHAMSCPVGTVRSRLHRARGLLAAKMRRQSAVAEMAAR